MAITTAPATMGQAIPDLRTICTVTAAERGLGLPPCLGCPLFEICERTDTVGYTVAAQREMAAWAQDREARLC